MSGIINFTLDHWYMNNATVTMVDEMLLQLLKTGPERDAVQVQVQLECNGLFLDLSDASMSNVVDTIADNLTPYIESNLEAEQRTAMLTRTLDLVAMAKLQQALNRASTSDEGSNVSPVTRDEMLAASQCLVSAAEQISNLHMVVIRQLTALLNLGWKLDDRLQEWDERLTEMGNVESRLNREASQLRWRAEQ